MSTIFEIGIKASLLKNNTKLSLIIAQTPTSTLEEIADCQTNTRIRNFIKNMFAGGVDSHIARMAQSQIVKEVVILPEFAIANDYWQELDTLISGFPGSLVVVAGIGFWKEDDLLKWKEASAHREFGFHAMEGFGSPYRTFNCGCIWIHLENSETRRVIFLKNYNEQRIEAPLIPSLVNGNYIVFLCFEDICLCPLICADVTCQSEQKPLDVVLKYLLEKGAGKKTLIATVAYEKNPGHPLWQRGIAHAVQKQWGTEAVILAIANTSVSEDSYRCTDDWRNLTGVFVATDFMRGQSDYPSIRCLESDRNIFGALVRTGEPALFAGEVSWDFGSGGYRDLWRPRLRALAECGGSLSTPEAGDRNRDELLHSLLSQREKLSSQIILERNMRAALEEVIGFIKSSSAPSARFLDQSMLYGLFKEEGASANVDRHRVREKRVQGARAIGALKISSRLKWQRNVRSVGQLRDSGLNILVWASPVKGNPAIRRDIQRWLTGISPHPPLLIFADGLGGTFDEGEVTAAVEGRVMPDRRADISAPPPDKRRCNFTANKIIRAAWLKDLRLIENSYEEEGFTRSIKTLLDRQMAEIRGYE